MFNTNAQCYQYISQVLLTSAFILWPTCTRGFGIREKIRCDFLAYFCAVLRFSNPPYAPLHTHQKIICRGVHFWYLMHNSYDQKISNQSNDKKRDPRVKRDVFGLVHISGPKLVNRTQFKVVERWQSHLYINMSLYNVSSFFAGKSWQALIDFAINIIFKRLVIIFITVALTFLGKIRNNL